MHVALVILDGWGRGSGSVMGAHRDAMAAAETPVFDGACEEGAVGSLRTDGSHVGLPTGQFGNSEVGHLNIGAGRVVPQASSRITEVIDRGDIAARQAIADAFAHASSSERRLHLCGLVGDGGVHARQSHLHGLIAAAADQDIDVLTHAFTDGRDTDPRSGVEHLDQFAGVAADAGTGHIATVVGRYYAMDRDENWERTAACYEALIDREASHIAPDGPTACRRSYGRDETDEFLEPTLIEGRPGIQAGDAVLTFNFRADRMRQLTRMLAGIDPEWSPPTSPPPIHLATMTAYDERFELPVAFEPHHPADVLGAVVSSAGMSQVRVAETEKYAHVTYFLNGGREPAYDGERRLIAPSPDVPTYDLRPAMAARAVTGRVSEALEADDPDLGVINYANPDMVGHTGDFEATVEAIEAVDEQLGRLLPMVRAQGADVLLTADHGNADDMGSAKRPLTAHTINPVPFVHLPPDGPSGYGIRDGGVLADVAPTVLALMNLEVPEAMTGRSLLD